MSEVTPDVARREERIEEEAKRSGPNRPAGYAEREAFGEYRPDPLSVFTGTRL